MSIIIIIILFVICLFIYRPSFLNFLLWLAICAGVFLLLNESAGIWGVLIYVAIWSYDGHTEERSSSKDIDDNSDESTQLYDKVYENGTHRVENLSNTGYYYSDGKESWVGMLGEEHRSNGEVVRENAYIPGRRDIYNASGEYIGYEYDSMGVTYRVDKS